MKIVTRYWPKPIPMRCFDWEACSSDYDMGDPIGYGKTEGEAIDNLLELIDMEQS